MGSTAEAKLERSRPEAEQLLWKWLRFGWNYRHIGSRPREQQDWYGERVRYEMEWDGDRKGVLYADVAGYEFTKPIDSGMRFRWPAVRR